MEEPQLLLGLEEGGPSLRVAGSQSSGLVSPLRKEAAGGTLGSTRAKRTACAEQGAVTTPALS